MVGPEEGECIGEYIVYLTSTGLLMEDAEWEKVNVQTGEHGVAEVM